MREGALLSCMGQCCDRAKGHEQAWQIAAAPVVGPSAQDVRPAFAKQGFASTDIVTRWSRDRGAEIAEHSQPEKIQWSRIRIGASRATGHARAARGRAHRLSKSSTSRDCHPGARQSVLRLASGRTMRLHQAPLRRGRSRPAASADPAGAERLQRNWAKSGTISCAMRLPGSGCHQTAVSCGASLARRVPWRPARHCHIHELIHHRLEQDGSIRKCNIHGEHEAHLRAVGYFSPAVADRGAVVVVAAAAGGAFLWSQSGSSIASGGQVPMAELIAPGPLATTRSDPPMLRSPSWNMRP